MTNQSPPFHGLSMGIPPTERGKAVYSLDDGMRLMTFGSDIDMKLLSERT